MTSQGRSAGSSRGGLGGGLPSAFLSTGTSSFIEFLSDYAPEMLPGGRTPPASAVGDEVPHGTTVVAAVFSDGVVVAGDRRSTAANMIAQREAEKVFRADDLSAIGYAGTAGLGVELIKIFQLELEHYEKMEGRVLSLQGKANRLATLIRNNLAMALQGLAVVPVFAGYDTERGAGRIFGYDASGGPFEELGFHAIGSGSVFAKGALKKLHRDDLSERDAVFACVHALYDAADDDTATGGPDLTRRIYPLVSAVTADGYRRLDDDEMGEIVRSVVDGRMDIPGGPPAPLH